MKKMKQLVCPISTEKVIEQVTRINALIAIILVLLGFMLNSVFFFLFLMADFYIRGFTRIKYSPLGFISYQMVGALNLNKKGTDKAPKIFAARLGFLISFIISLLFVFHLNSAAMVVAGILVFFAALEFALAVCMGCIIYTYLILPFYK